MVNNILVILFFNILIKDNNIEVSYDYLDAQIQISLDYFEDEYKEYQVYLSKQYFKGEHKDVIIKKINRYLHSNLKNKGEFIVTYSLEKGVDPYLVTAVILQETGCYWNCSKLARTCNNYGGNKGKPACNGGSYRKFATQEEGLKFAINKLAKYYKKGLTTPEKINPKYATDKTWYNKVNNYIKKLKK